MGFGLRFISSPVDGHSVATSWAVSLGLLAADGLACEAPFPLLHYDSV